MDALRFQIKSLCEENAKQEMNRAAGMRELRAEMSKLCEGKAPLTLEVEAFRSDLHALRQEIKEQEERRALEMVQFCEVRVNNSACPRIAAC